MNPRKKRIFVRQDIHKRKGLEFKWRSPKGIDSKMRLGKKGHRKKPSPGYGAPKGMYGLLKGGIMGVLVSNVADLGGIDPGKMGAIISSAVGKKKRVEIIRECVSRKIKVINVRDAENFAKDVSDWMEAKKQQKKSEKKTEKKQEKKQEEKDLSEKLMTAEEKKAEEKKEIDRILTKKDAL